MEKTTSFSSDSLSDFSTALYESIFPPKTPTSPLPSSLSLSLTPGSSSSSPSSSTTTAAHDDAGTEHRLHQASLILEFQVLRDCYEISLSRLKALTDELNFLRSENSDLRLVNTELLKFLSLSSRSAATDVSSNRLPRGTLDRISVRSSTTPVLPPVSERLMACITGKNEPKEAGVEMEVCSQGMWKTELCNKWQEKGKCPYGANCQFAHGINELRPVVRHPRYKTQPCRMILAGDTCPYGHRCHFRHSLTEQERKSILMRPR